MAYLIHYQAGSGTSARTSTIANNNTFAYLDSTPFDGLVLNLSLTYSFQTPGTTTSYATAQGQLAPIVGKLTKCVHHYANVHAQFYADPFDDWTQAQANWVNLAQALHDAGMDGIYYDNEEYSGLFWAYPGAAYKYTSTKSLSQYAEQWRLRGNQLMTAMKVVHPTIRVVHAHTAAWSQANSPYLTISGGRGGPAQSDGSDLRGYFQVGMMAAFSNHSIDGGEDYAFRTASDFQGSWNWLHNTWPTITPNTVVPASLVSSWSSIYDVAFGVYDQTYGSTVTMTPSVMQSCVTYALNRADTLVWTYSEGNDYLTPNSSTTATNFVNAIAAGKAAAAPVAPSAPQNLRITAHS